MSSENNKYHKYKKKYIELKTNIENDFIVNQRGGGQVFPLMDEIHFWARQLAEHALFLHLGLEHAELKNQALSIHKKWTTFLSKNFYDRGINVTLDTVTLTPTDLTKVKNFSVKDFNNGMLTELIAFNQSVVDILKTGKWIGSIYLGLAEHMLSEAIYFQNKITGKTMTVAEEIAFINKHHGQEMGVTAQLINPSDDQQKIIDLVRSYAMKKMSEYLDGHALSLSSNEFVAEFPKKWTSDEERYLQSNEFTDELKAIELSIRYGDELIAFAKDTNQKIESNSLKSVINPILGKHAYREFVRFTETLRSISQ